jgi:hypothetical protein
MCMTPHELCWCSYPWYSSDRQGVYLSQHRNRWLDRECEGCWIQDTRSSPYTHIMSSSCLSRIDRSLYDRRIRLRGDDQDTTQADILCSDWILVSQHPESRIYRIHARKWWNNWSSVHLVRYEWMILLEYSRIRGDHR